MHEAVEIKSTVFSCTVCYKLYPILMNNQELAKKTESIFVSQCWHRGYASPVQVLLDLGYLSKKDYESWRKGSVPYLEKVCQTNLSKLSFIMKQIRSCAVKYHCRPSFTVYHRKGKKLRFSKTGDPGIEKNYATHYVNMNLKKKDEPKETDG